MIPASPQAKRIVAAIEQITKSPFAQRKVYQRNARVLESPEMLGSLITAANWGIPTSWGQQGIEFVEIKAP
jgi:hypothetical protein